MADGRDYRLDFFRGLALFFIFIDHIPNNALSYLTVRSFALSDAAEVFILISGYTAALVYGRAMLHEGVLMAGARIYRRAWQLYVAHLCLFMLFSTEVAYTVQRFNNPLFMDELGIGEFLHQPDKTLVRVLLLQLQPTFMDILPLYISLLVVFPFFMIAMRRHAWLAFGPSIILYILAQTIGINLPGYPEGDGWYFNPFAWQLLFVIGAHFGFARARGRGVTAPRREVVVLAAVIAGAGLVIQVSWTLHELFPGIPGLLMHALWPIDKGTLPLIRIANVLALAVLVAWLVPPQARFMTGRIGWPVALCGQHSLYVFCLGILLSMLGNIVFTQVGQSVSIHLAVNVTGILAMIGLGLLIAWYNNGGRLPPRPGAPGSTEAAA